MKQRVLVQRLRDISRKIVVSHAYTRFQTTAHIKIKEHERGMVDSTLVYHTRDPGFNPHRNQNIYARVSSRKRLATSREYPCPRNHLSKNPSFGTGIKIVCSWQLNNQRIKHMREV